MGKCPLDVLHSRAASLTAGRMDLNAPEGERGEPYYFWPTERPHGQGQSKAQRLRASPGKPQLLISSCSDQSCVKLCEGEKSGASRCSSLVCYPPHPSLHLPTITIFLFSLSSYSTSCSNYVFMIYSPVKFRLNLIIFMEM